jgi:hypothetical protein
VTLLGPAPVAVHDYGDVAGCGHCITFRSI